MQLKRINVSDVFLKVTDKAEQLDTILEKDNIKREQVLYMGDDIPDSYPMHMVGLPCCHKMLCQKLRPFLNMCLINMVEKDV